VKRRQLLAGFSAGAAVAAGGAYGLQRATAHGDGRHGEDGEHGDGGRRKLALVYRGPAACPGCAESVAALLRSARLGLTVAYVGPGEQLPLTAATLAKAEVYAQPGGNNDVDGTWRHLAGSAAAVRDWVRAGGRYLGFCMGGYLAGDDPGFAVLPGDTDAYTSTPGASVHSAADTVVAVRWRGRRRHMYFQDGPYFTLHDGARATVLATYGNGRQAAVVAAYGAGRTGVVGPHPEADRSWYADAGLTNPDGVRLDLGRDLVRTTLRA